MLEAEGVAGGGERGSVEVIGALGGGFGGSGETHFQGPLLVGKFRESSLASPNDILSIIKRRYTDSSEPNMIHMV